MSDPGLTGSAEHPGVSTRVEPLDGARPWSAGLARIASVNRSRPLLLIGVFLVATLAMLWPLPLHAGSAVQDLIDPLYEIWTMRWVQHQLVTNPLRLWDGNTGYPFPDSLLFSEPRLSTSVIAWPIQLLTGNSILSYNVMLLGSYVLVGIGMAALIWELTGEFGPAILAGVAAAFTPYRFGHLSHLNLLSYGWSLLALWSIVRFARTRSWGDAALGTIFLTVQLLASDTVGVMAGFMAVLAVIFVVWQERKRLTARLAGGLAAILILPVVAEIPIILARLRVDRMYGFSRDLTTVSRMSATLQSYVSVCPGDHFWEAVGILPVAYPNPLFPGTLVCLAAVAGLILAGRTWPRWTLYAGIVTVTGVTLSLGPFSVIGGHRYHLPYYYLYQDVPGFNAMRDAARFGMLALIGVEILAGLGLAAGWRLLRPRLPSASTRFVGTALVVALMTFTGVELKTGVGTARVPRDPGSIAVYSWLARQPNGPVIELPANGLWANLGWTAREIYFSTQHWDPIVAAYTSFVPQRDIDMLVSIHGGTDAPSLVSAANVGLLQDLKIRYVVIHHWPGYDWQEALAEAARLPMLKKVGDVGDATVYTLTPGNRVPVRYSIVAPSAANAAKEVVFDFVTRNDNPTGAISWLDLDPTATVVWKSSDGVTVSETTMPVHLGVTVNPGLTIEPIRLSAPSRPGSYRLSIDCPSLHQSLETVVTVAAPPGLNPGDAPFRLRRLLIPPGPYRPGDRLQVTAEWEVGTTVSQDLSATIQLLNERNKPFSQWDGLPLGASLPTSDWQAGEIVAEPLLISIPTDLNSGRFRALVALYDEASPTLKRLPIQRPDGSTGLEYVSDPMTVTSDGR